MSQQVNPVQPSAVTTADPAGGNSEFWQGLQQAGGNLLGSVFDGLGQGLGSLINRSIGGDPARTQEIERRTHEAATPEPVLFGLGGSQLSGAVLIVLGGLMGLAVLILAWRRR